MHRIPIHVEGWSRDAAAALASERMPPGATLEARTELSGDARPAGMHLDAATLALIIDATKDVLVASVGAIATIYAARIAKGPAPASPAAAAPAASRPPVLEIETIDDIRTISVSSADADAIRSALPDNVRAVLSIRLREAGAP